MLLLPPSPPSAFTAELMTKVEDVPFKKKGRSSEFFQTLLCQRIFIVPLD
jgi:hypothetical protein